MMKPSKKLAISVVLLLFLLSVLGSITHGDEPLESRILQRVADEQNVALNRLEIGALEAVALPLTGLTLYQAKVVDTATGEVTGLVVDGNSRVHSLEEARHAERAAYEERYGRLHPDLADRLEAMLDGELLTVAIWLQAGEVTPLDRPALEHQPAAVGQGDAELPLTEPALASSAEEKAAAGDSEAIAARVAAIKAEETERRAALEAAQQANLAHMETQVAAVQAPLLADLAAQGVEPAYISPYAPLIYVELPKSEILSLSERADVDMVYGPNQNRDLMNSAKPTQKADIVDDWWGFDGSGIAVAILEDSRVEFSNPYLNAGTTRVPGHANVDNHATATAGMVASQHSTYQGIAQGAYIYSANATDYADTNLSAAMDWAVSVGAEIINNSWGDPTGTGLNQHDRHLDYIVRNYLRTVTVAAGNENDGCATGTGKVTSPARGFNMISVGNYADQNTLTWDGDAMDACSSYIDPSTYIWKPEVAAVGSSINSTTAASPWTGNVGSGTSYAAPMVAGEAALLMERNSALMTWPEIVKAIIMATALNNIEGDSRLSDYDGAGGVDMRAAFRLVDEGWWHGVQANSTSFPYNYYVWVYAGETARAAIAWDSNPNGTYTSDPLQADIDLRVYDPSGGFVTSSISSSNSYEIVEFTAATTGYYRLEVDDWSFTGSTEYVGAAWWPSHRVLTAYAPQVLAAPPTSRHYYRFSAQPYWNAVAVRPASGSDHDQFLYANSAFGDPDDYDPVNYSNIGGSAIDFVLVDRNHAPSGSYYPEVRQYSGTGDYAIEWATHSADTIGTYGPYSMSTSQVLRVWDSLLDAAVRTYFAVKPTSGNADLGMALYDSDPATSSTWYQSRGQYVAYADAAGAGGDEYMNYQISTTDRLGLVVWNNSSTSNTTFYLYTDTSAPTGSILVNGGATYANSTSVTLNLSASDAQTGIAEMRFSNIGEPWSSWEPYASSKSWTLPAGDGVKWVYAQFRNNANMVSTAYYDGIDLDTAAPTGSIVINGGATYATSTSVNLGLSANDGLSGVSQMRFSNDGSSWGSWESYTTSKSWTFTSGDGVKAVYVQYRDNAGNVSGSYSDSIVLDTTVPTGSIVINGGAAYANSTSVSLSLSASDATSGMADMRFSNDSSTWSSWQPYAANESWTLVAGDGTKSVYVQYRDNAGHVSSSYSDSIILDTAAPTGSIVIEGGATYANSTSVALSLSASDATSGVDDMRFSNDGSTWSSWQPFAASESWTLAAGDGSKTVYVQYRDNAGNASASYSDTIMLDATAPAGSIVIDGGAPYATSTSVNLGLAASDGGSGVADMRFSNNSSTWSGWEPYASGKSWTLVAGDGTKTVYVQYRDNAGNISGSYNDTIILDTAAPTGSILVNGGAAHANSTLVALTLSASDAGSGVAEMRFSNDGGTWTGWESYATSKSWTLAAGDGSKTVYVQYRDNVANVSTSYTDSIILDTAAPTSSATSPPSSASVSFTVSWSGSDSLSGIANYDVQYRVGSGGAWTDWLAGTTSTSATFGPASPVVVVRDQAYYFRVRARDNAGNLEAYPGGDGDSSTYVEEVFFIYLPVSLRNY